MRKLLRSILDSRGSEMAEKRWNEMSYSEKCDSLKESMERIYEIASQLATELRQTHRQFESKLNEVAKAVEIVAAQIRELGDKKK